MSKRVGSTTYKKWKGADGRGRYTGRVHLIWYDKAVKAYRFVCGKRDGGPALSYHLGHGWDTDDDAIVTCVGCKKQAPEVVEAMDNRDVPDLWDLQ